MEYFSNNIQFSLLKNYLINDPILDYFNIHENDYHKDDISYYKNYIIKESNDYKFKFFKKIIEISELNILIQNNIQETIQKIKNNIPLIIQGILFDENEKLLISCDIIIKYKLFRKLFPKIINIPFHLLLKKNDYLLINISYSTVNFNIDLKNIHNDNLIFYKKCKLYSFQKIFNQYTKYKSYNFIMAKEYKYKNILLSKKEFIGFVSINDKIKYKIKNARNWIHYLKENNHKIQLYPEPSCNELYPNMNHNESEWENEKLKLANEIKEITLIWKISYDQRCGFLDKNIKCWDDPKLLNELKNTKNKNIQEKIIHINQQNDILISPRISISNDFKKILLKSKYDLFFDIESFLSFDEKNGLFDDIIKKKDPILAIIGLIHNEKYKDFTIQDFTIQSEKKIIHNFANFLHYLSNKNNTIASNSTIAEQNNNANEIINIYHWGQAELNYFKYINENYPLISFHKFNLINVLDYFRTEPIIIQGIFNFGLKSIGSALYKHKFIKTTWNKNDNGLETMIRFKEICIHHNRLIPLKRYVEVKEIIEYNRIDCQVLYEIVDLLRNKYI